MRTYENNRSRELRRRRRRRAARKQRRRRCLFLCAILLAVGIARVRVGAGEGKKGSNTQKIRNQIENGLQVNAKTKNQDANKLLRKYEDLLVLVNKDHEMPKDYNLERKSICQGRLEAADILYDDLVEMLADADDAGYQFYIASAYRSAAHQQKLIDNDIKKWMKTGKSYEIALEETYRQVMPAGYSEHETGLALDFLSVENSNLDVTQEVCPGNQWLRAHCMEYGFILRYPKGKETVTGIDYEPWHFRYVGREAARYLSENDFTLEEFWEMLM